MEGVITRLRQLASHPKVVAIGETGLDFYHEGHDERAVQVAQLDSFHAHLALAKELSMPVVVHTRNARRQTLDAIRAVDSSAAGVLHCFTEDWGYGQSGVGCRVLRFNIRHCHLPECRHCA
jgi:TatD DNase family protein